MKSNIFSSVFFLCTASLLPAATFVVMPPNDLAMGTNSTFAPPPVSQYVESYAFSTTNDTLIAAIRVRIANGQSVHPTIRLAAGGDGVNRDYLTPGARAWNWHVAELVALDDQLGIIEVAIVPPPYIQQRDTNLRAFDVSLAQYLSSNGDLYASRRLTRIYEITPDDVGKVVNVSNRGVLGTGAKVLICGFIVQGTSPRLVLVRALGPTLVSYGVDGAAADPSLRLFRGQTLLAANDDWGMTTAKDSIPAGLAPGNAKESAIVMILEPGLYTAQATSADQGVGLIDVFDLSALK